MKGVKFKDILKDYLPDQTIFRNDDAMMNRIKHILFEELSEADRNIIIYYAENASMQDTADRMKVCKSTMMNHIRRIRQQIIEKLND